MIPTPAMASQFAWIGDVLNRFSVWVTIGLTLMAACAALVAFRLALIEFRTNSTGDDFRFDTYRAMTITCMWHAVFCSLAFLEPSILTTDQVPFLFWFSVYMGTLVFLFSRISYHRQKGRHPFCRRRDRNGMEPGMPS